MRSFAKGDRGNEVVDIQVKLSTLGYNLGLDGVDGSFGELTEEAVKKFQQSRGLKITGLVDEETWRALVEATYKLGDRLLYLRLPFFRGDDVRELQLSLNTLGFNTGIVDGIYGETTERAVRDFQKNFGLPSDGIFGPSTLISIRNLSHLITNKASRIFPDPHRGQHSALSTFQDRKIAVDLGTIYSPGAALNFDDQIEIEQDLGMRLGNLLELLGANVVYTGENDLNSLDGIELYVGFRLNSSEAASSRGSAVLYSDATPESRLKGELLAAKVQEEVTRALGSEDLGVKPYGGCLRVNSTVPIIFIKPFFITNPKEKALLDEEVNRQKIAVAVFDGITSYLQVH